MAVDDISGQRSPETKPHREKEDAFGSSVSATSLDLSIESAVPEVLRVSIRTNRLAQSKAGASGVEDRLSSIEEDSASARTEQARLIARMDAMERQLEALRQTEEKRSVSHLRGVDSVSIEATQQSKVGSMEVLHSDEGHFGDAAIVELGELEVKAASSDVGMPAMSIGEVVPEGVPLDCKWTDSLWDAALFIAAPWVSRSDSTLMTLLLLVCGIVQVVFLGITRLIFNEPMFTAEKLDRLEQWRINIGHNVKHYDSLSMTSLTQRVCRPDLYEAEMSSATSKLVSEMYKYIGTYQFFNGPSLVKVALLIWGLTVLHEIMHIWDLSRAIRALPRVRHRSFVEVLGINSDRLRISSITHGRYYWILFLVVWRLGMTLALWGFGNLFLCYYSIAPSEILLNALSLEIILHIDDAMYVLVPSRVKQIINRIEPLQAPNRCFQLMKTDLRPYLLFVLMIVLIFVTDLTALTENASAISSANATLCSGRQDFIYTLDPFYLVYVSETNPRNMSAAQIDSLGFSKAVRETIFPDTIPNMTRIDPLDPDKEVASPDAMTFEFTVNSIEGVVVRSTWDLEQASMGLQGLANEQCSDILFFMTGVRRFIVEALNGSLDNHSIAEVQTCQDIASLCSSWPIARAVCPVTCGCTSPSSALLLDSPSNGCPEPCSDQESYTTELAQLPCMEKSPTELSTDPVWGALAVQLSSSLDEVFKNKPEMSPCGAKCTEDFSSMGCAFITLWKARMIGVGWYSDPCSGNFLGEWLFAKPLAVYCPMTCGCISSTQTAEVLMSAGCPGQCANGGI